MSAVALAGNRTHGNSRCQNAHSLAPRVPASDASFRTTRRYARPAPAGNARGLAWKGTVSVGQQRLAAVQRHPDRLATFRELEQVSGAIAAASMSSTQNPTADLGSQLRALARRREQLERELAADPRLAAELKAIAPPAPAKVRDALPADAALVDLVEYDSPGWAGSSQEGRRIAAFVVRAGRPIVRVELGPTAAVATDLDAWAPWSLRATTPDGLAAAARLRGRVWGPLEAALTGAKTVVLSPDGVAGRIPFAALPGEKAGTVLLEDVALATVPVPQAVPELLARKPEPAGGSLLLVGDVDFDAGAPGAERPARTGRRFVPLTGTKAEADAVRALWGSWSSGAVDEFRGAAATESAVRGALGKARYAHLATHGYLGDAARRGSDPTEANNPFLFTVEGYAPGALSALVLAGANRGAAGGDDGFFTALELGGLNLGGVELVVLSACDTGAGRTEAGEGVLGLQRAFQVAGARAVAATLWPVDDAATRALMIEFYRNLWVRKLPKAEALRQAQLRFVRGELMVGGEGLAAVAGAPAAAGTARGVTRPAAPLDPRAPYYWAAFVLSGEWR